MNFTPRCPICRALVHWEGNPHRPFCSERCQLVDLGSWASERYRIPGEAVDPAAEDDADSDESDPA